ncbi:hypothetical protein JCM17960_19480 [Magnetospira thiophila]
MKHLRVLLGALVLALAFSAIPTSNSQAWWWPFDDGWDGPYGGGPWGYPGYGYGYPGYGWGGYPGYGYGYPGYGWGGYPGYGYGGYPYYGGYGYGYPYAVAPAAPATTESK